MSRKYQFRNKIMAQKLEYWLWKISLSKVSQNIIDSVLDFMYVFFLYYSGVRAEIPYKSRKSGLKLLSRIKIVPQLFIIDLFKY